MDNLSGPRLLRCAGRYSASGTPLQECIGHICGLGPVVALIAQRKEKNISLGSVRGTMDMGSRGPNPAECGIRYVKSLITSWTHK